MGLPDGLMGNSEVGHFTIGTGRVSYQVRHTICTVKYFKQSSSSYQFHAYTTYVRNHFSIFHIQT